MRHAHRALPRDALDELDASGLADALCRGAVTPLEAAERALRRIDALNPQINAVTWTREAALDEARCLTPSGPFGGVPLLLKGALAEALGEPMTCGAVPRGRRRAP